jgi:hypothetical protein
LAGVDGPIATRRRGRIAHSPERALDWARGEVARDGLGEEPAVVGAVIQLGACLDLTNVAYTAGLRQAYEHTREAYRRAGKPLPANTERPNRFAARPKGKVVAVVLEPDVAAVFPTSEAVNQALRVLAHAAQKRVRVTKRASASKARRSSKRMQRAKRG